MTSEREARRLTGPDYLQRNQDYWDQQAAAYTDPGRRNWSQEPSWGIWDVPEVELNLLVINAQP